MISFEVGRALLRSAVYKENFRLASLKFTVACAKLNITNYFAFQWKYIITLMYFYESSRCIPLFRVYTFLLFFDPSLLHNASRCISRNDRMSFRGRTWNSFREKMFIMEFSGVRGNASIRFIGQGKEPCNKFHRNERNILEISAHQRVLPRLFTSRIKYARICPNPRLVDSFLSNFCTRNAFYEISGVETENAKSNDIWNFVEYLCQFESKFRIFIHIFTFIHVHFAIASISLMRVM